jgi:hypothetical protein
MILPTVHSNGTSREHLVQLRLDVVAALRVTIGAMVSACPHARDFDPQEEGAYDFARGVWQGRLTKLHDLRAELEAEALEIQNS